MSTSRREQLVVRALPRAHGTTVTARRHELTIDAAATVAEEVSVRASATVGV
ncbi:hypothetical protein JWS13_18670 [Rhodococcus pseudokoreensis]|uniref:Uncharacterized protein n=1 Tax=Rhodococcus pseudokoreensis TaxID=2811421 RepID=A0A974WI64_9NOCA|nr:hypothetical protein [Rhodococcus pseudokoreensis]QSE95823.1 hypothetical protein JWS13_18670 [Rhodococcus pseudokoreensis]